MADRLAATVLIALLHVYKILISPLFTGSCRFLPSCSEYAREALAAHGAARGGYLAARRLCRCHPFCEGGHDPVPAVGCQDTGRTTTRHVHTDQDFWRSKAGSR